MPETTVTISNFALTRLQEVKDAYAKTYIGYDAICIFFIELIDEGLTSGKMERLRVKGNDVLDWKMSLID